MRERWQVSHEPCYMAGLIVLPQLNPIRPLLVEPDPFGCVQVLVDVVPLATWFGKAAFREPQKFTPERLLLAR